MKQRLVHVDVLRGICIFAVMYVHLAGYSVDDVPMTGVRNFLILFFIKMFFFISGYVGYKESARWDFTDIKAFFLKKVNTLLIPTICAMSLCQVVCKGGWTGLWDAISGGAIFLSSSKGGYWFTVSLFVMELVYCAIMVGISRFKKWAVGNSILVVAMLVAYVLYKTHVTEGVVSDLLCFDGVLKCLPFFLLGVLGRREQDVFHKLMANRWVQLALLVVLVMGLTTNIVPQIVHSVTICLVVYYVVKGFCEHLGECQEAIIGGISKKTVALLSVIGRYTLQIYFLHYMLLFRLPDSVSAYLLQSHVAKCYGHTYSSVVEWMIIGSCSLLMCFLCISLSLIIKQLPFAHKLLFGKS